MSSLLPTARQALRRTAAMPTTLLRSSASSSSSPSPSSALLLRLGQQHRLSSSSAPLTFDPSMSPAETDIASVLAADENLRPTTSLLVRDVSGGCGSMYAIEIASPRFRGKGLLAQQRLVTRALGDRVKEWHGVQIRTTVPPEEEGADPAAKS